MRGEVLHYDETQGFGFITGSDGNRYTFRREDLRREAALGKGAPVEFQARGGQASNVFAIRATVASLGADAAPASPMPTPSVQFGRHATGTSLPPITMDSSTGIWDYFRRGLTANYVNFRDRARRKEFWGYCLLWTIATFVLLCASLAVDGAAGNFDGDDVPWISAVVMTVWMLGTFLPGLAITIRRQHDIGLSGWFYLLILIPYIGSLIIFVFTLIPSQRHENKWGPVPAGVRSAPPHAPTQA